MDDIIQPQAEPAPLPPTGIDREKPEQTPGETDTVNLWLKKIESSRGHWEKVYKRMKRDQDFARGKQWPGDVEDDPRYVANIVQRHISQRTSALYAKNPRFLARRRKQMDFMVWDGNYESLQLAMQALQMASQAAAVGLPVPPEVAMAQMVVQDAHQGLQRRQMLDKICKTSEILMQHQIQEQFPPFKKQMKQLIRRTLTCSVGFVKLGFERFMKMRPEDAEKTRDLTIRMAQLENLAADIQDEVSLENIERAKYELQQQIDFLKTEPQQIVREGLVFDYPQGSKVIIDKRCRQLQGFVGARFIAQEFQLSVDEVQKIYKVDLRVYGFKPYAADGEGTANTRGDHSKSSDSTQNNNELAQVFEVYDKDTGMMFTIATGCSCYLRQPSEPDVVMDRFWPFFVLTFNDVEHEKDIYPPSDVELMRHMQLEHNRSREALREHRIAAAPGYASASGALSDDDKKKLGDQQPHDVVELQGLAVGEKIADKLQPLPKQNIDPNLYSTNESFDDVLKVLGTQEAVMGGTSSATATEVSVGEGARMSSVASNVDDLDDFMNELARGASQILLKEFSEETVKKICGPGAVWPVLSAQEIADEIFMEVEAGSSGRPNRAVDIKNFMDLSPLLMQIPGVRPEWLARQGITRLDDRLDLEDAFLSGMPSIMAANKMAQVSQGPPGQDPNQQGDQGGNNAEKAQSAAPQPNEQPAAGAVPGEGTSMLAQQM